jgi:hypothetical protein
MDKAIIYSLNKAFSDHDIYEACDGQVNIYQYKQIKNMQHIDDLLEPYGACVILYTTKKNYGHWVTLLRQADKSIEHFDSYGFKPDDELEFVPDSYKHVDAEDYPYLTRLLYDAVNGGGYKKIIYNEHKLQQYKGNINTCGRWAAMRVILKELSLKEFIKLFTKQHFSPDWYVTAMTLFI